MLMNTSDYDQDKHRKELEATVIEPEIIPEWGYGFFQHHFHRDISILYNKLDDGLISRLKEHAISNRDEDYRYGLAGQISEEYITSFDKVPELKKELDDILKTQVKNFLGYDVSDEFDWIAWTNITKPSEFNPVHAHTNCILSWVLYLDIPEVIRHEFREPLTTCASKGLIKFYSNYSAHDLTFNPRTGDMFLFTSNHRHAVGAFYTEGVERISLAGNITKL